MFAWYKSRCLKSILGFTGGFALGQLYYIYLLKDIQFPLHIGFYVCLVLSFLIGVANATSEQFRCISLLLLPMYCGKPGRGVLKAVVLIYVVAGPVTNMGLNAKEVVRVYACSTELSYNLSRTKYSVVAGPLRRSLLSLKSELAELKDTFRSIQKVVDPIQLEIEDSSEQQKLKIENDYIDDMLGNTHRSYEIERKYSYNPNDKEEVIYQKKYMKKVEYRCEHQLSQGVYTCMKAFTLLYEECCNVLPEGEPITFCAPLKLPIVCNLSYLGNRSACDCVKQIDPGIGEGYTCLKNIKNEFVKNNHAIKMQYKISYDQDLYDIQDAKETGTRVMHAFEEKYLIMQSVITVVNLCLALLFLRVAFAAQAYHDMYLTNIDFDNIYITSYLKRIDRRRMKKDKNSLLPLKKVLKILNLTLKWNAVFP